MVGAGDGEAWFAVECGGHAGPLSALVGGVGVVPHIFCFTLFRGDLCGTATIVA